MPIVTAQVCGLAGGTGKQYTSNKLHYTQHQPFVGQLTILAFNAASITPQTLWVVKAGWYCCALCCPHFEYQTFHFQTTNIHVSSHFSAQLCILFILILGLLTDHRIFSIQLCVCDEVVF